MTTSGMTRRRIGALLAASALLASPARAGEVRTVTWDELSTRLAAADNPFAKLTPEQLLALSDLAALRDRKARGNALTVEEQDIERAAASRLRRDRIDPDRLLGLRDEIARTKREAAALPNATLDGKTVRLAGYVLPLEYAGRKVVRFLLVPWIGACIHTPPPEPNQIVHVKPDRAFEVDSAFQAVWVTGRMSTKASRQSVEIVDGASNVDVGYALEATQVDRYKP